ncbi:MAG: CAP domain-containing protein [Bacteroidia bacterium]|jgi:uncharacterized protein YkwD|nr:CAP domain-containing protein [Bacteroidia bacterium]
MKLRRPGLVSFIAAFVICPGAAPHPNHKAELDKAEEKSAFEYLNKIRQNPASFSAEFKVNLNMVKPRPALKWNDTLARVAEAKALDMATHNYFGHVDKNGYGMNYYINKAGYQLDAYMLNDKKANFFESINAGADNGIDGIKDLIIDKGTPGHGHRTHLLGISDFYANLTDIGIGFARVAEGADKEKGGDTYATYMSVVIAKHHYQ